MTIQLHLHRSRARTALKHELISWTAGTTVIKQQLQSDLNSTACLITGTRNLRALSVMVDDLHWLNVFQRLQYKLAMTVHHCLQHWAPRYLTDYCVPVSEVPPGHQHLRSARRHQLSVPWVHCSTSGSRAFSVARPTVWNSLTDDLWDAAVDSQHFRNVSKTRIHSLDIVEH